MLDNSDGVLKGKFMDPRYVSLRVFVSDLKSNETGTFEELPTKACDLKEK